MTTIFENISSMQGTSVAQDCEGSIFKRSDDVIKSWNKRFCRYENETKLFAYWEEEIDCRNGKPPRGAFLITGAQGCSADVGTLFSSEEKQYGIKLEGSKLGIGKVTWLGYVESAKDHKQWMEALQGRREVPVHVSTKTGLSNVNKDEDGKMEKSTISRVLFGIKGGEANEERLLRAQEKQYQSHIKNALVSSYATKALVIDTSAELDRQKESLNAVEGDLDSLELIQNQTESLLQKMANPITYAFSTQWEYAKRRQAQIMREQFSAAKRKSPAEFVKDAAIRRVALQDPKLAKKFRDSKNDDLAALSNCLEDLNELASEMSEEIERSTEQITKIEERVAETSAVLERQQAIAKSVTEKSSAWGIVGI